MANEAVSAYFNQLTNEAMGLYFRAVANNYPLLYLDKGTDEAIITKLAAVEITWRYYPHSISTYELADAGLDYSRNVQVIRPGQGSQTRDLGLMSP